MKPPGSLFILAAASGTGKTSLASALASSIKDICISISHTTRLKRFGEFENSSYFFIEKNVFEKMIEANEFLEYATVFDNHYYGTSKKWVFEKLTAGCDVILDIDWQGAQKVRVAFPEVVSIFLLPPSKEAQKQRLLDRKRDSVDIIENRLIKASSEIQHYHEFDYLVINDDFEQALSELKNIILSYRFKCSKQAVRYEKLLAELTSNN